MDWKRIWALAVLVMTFGTAAARAQGTDIAVRVFNNYGVPSDDLHEAQNHAAASLKAAGIDVTWINCWYGDRAAVDAPGRCREGVGGDLVLRLQRASKAAGDGYVSLGFSLVMPEGIPFLATVYADIAEGVARRAGVETRPLLGRAIAHEIGHLLLNSNSHPDRGLMRGAWSQRELRTNAPHDWEFGQSEADTMRTAVIRRR